MSSLLSKEFIDSMNGVWHGYYSDHIISMVMTNAPNTVHYSKYVCGLWEVDNKKYSIDDLFDPEALK